MKRCFQRKMFYPGVVTEEPAPWPFVFSHFKTIFDNKTNVNTIKIICINKYGFISKMYYRRKRTQK